MMSALASYADKNYNVEPNPYVSYGNGVYINGNQITSLPVVVEGSRKPYVDVIDALFLLKPALAEAYKTKDGDGKREFYKDILAAAKAKKATNAHAKLTELLELGD